MYADALTSTRNYENISYHEVLFEASQRASEELKIYLYDDIPWKPDLTNCNSNFISDFAIGNYFANSNMLSNPEKANYYLIPLPFACLVNVLRPKFRSIFLDNLDRLIDHTIQNYPFYNQSLAQGHINHIMFITKDLGRCNVDRMLLNCTDIKQKEIWIKFKNFLKTLIVISNFGYKGHNVTFEVMTKGFASCQNKSWSLIEDLKDCNYFRHNDIVIPQHHQFVHSEISHHHNVLPPIKRHDIYFTGTIKCGGVTSRNSRTSINELAMKYLSNQSFYFKNTTGKVVDRVNSSYFALCPSGSAPWSSRIYESLFHNAIPVIMASKIMLPFEKFLDWPSAVMDVPLNNSNSNSTSELWPYFQKMQFYSDEYRRYIEQRNIEQLSSTYIYQKQLAGKVLTEWLHWDGNKSKNIFKLISLQLWCLLTENIKYCSIFN